MEVKKITLNKAITCNEKDKVSEIAKKLKENDERRIFVVDANKKLKGIITTTDLVYKTLCKSGELTGEEVMTKNVKSVEVNEDLNKALEIMNSLKTFTCPVTQGDILLGVITYQDLVSHVVKSAGG